jgi:hypothetical protein
LNYTGFQEFSAVNVAVLEWLQSYNFSHFPATCMQLFECDTLTCLSHNFFVQFYVRLARVATRAGAVNPLSLTLLSTTFVLEHVIARQLSFCPQADVRLHAERA